MHPAVLVEISVIQIPWAGSEILVRAVESPITEDNVHPAIPVKIARRHTAPQSRQVAQLRNPSGQHPALRRLTQWNVPLFKMAVFIKKYARRSPFGRQDQIGIAVAVEIAEDRPGHQARLGQHAAGRYVSGELSA